MDDEAKQAITDQINAMGLTLECTFIPWSRSRNAPKRNAKDADKRKGWLSLNWEVRLMRAGRIVLATEYSQGSGHAPAVKTYAKAEKRDRDAAIRWECENGRRAKGAILGSGDGPRPMFQGGAIEPKIMDVLWSLVCDAEVLNYSGFDDWAENLGFDTDSREAERTYRACLEIALKLRGAIGQDNLDKLNQVYVDY